MRSFYQNFLHAHNIPIGSTDLFIQSITHKSYVESGLHQKVGLYNETLEFLGDSVLGFIISAHLCEIYPDRDQGYLSKLKSYIVSKQFLFTIAENLHLIDAVRVKGVDLERGKFSSILADAVEALIGAVYLESGIEQAKKFILAHFIPLIHMVTQEHHEKDFKSMLQHYVQKYYNCKPVYQLKSTSGPDHNKIFSVNVSIDSRVFGPCMADSKKQAEQNVAKLVCDTLFANEEHEKFF